MIGDDETLNHCTQLMILSDHEIWMPPIQPNVEVQDFTNTIFLHTVDLKNTGVLENNDNSTDQYGDENHVEDPNVTVATETPSTSSVDTKLAFENFLLPWEKLPTVIINSLQNMKYLQKNDMQIVANLFVSELKTISTEISKSVMKAVAKQAANKYPNSFLEMEKGVFLTTEPYTLVEKMVNIYHYSRRSPHAKTHTLQELKVPLAESRKRKCFADSVLNYQPNIIDSEPQMIIKKQWLQNMCNSVEEAENLDTIRSHMNNTYGLQRKDINAQPIYDTLTAEWPYLLRSEYFDVHFQLLTGKNLGDFSSNFENLRESIIKVTSAKNSKSISQLLPKVRHEPDEIKCLKLLCAYFNESACLIIKEFEVNEINFSANQKCRF
jgi:hypothetical protein